MLGDHCDDLDGFWDDQLCGAARARFRLHLGGCKLCQEELRYRMQLSAITGFLRRPRLPERVLELARAVRDVGPVVVAYAALAVVVAVRGGWEAQRARWTVRW